MIRTWKCLLGAWAVCAIFCHAGYSEDVVEIDELGVARVPPPANAPRPADVLYSDSEAVWYNDFQPPPGVGVDPVTVPQDNSVGYAVTSDVAQVLYRINRVNRHYHGLDEDGFTSAGAFVPIQVFDNGNALFAIDPRAFVSDNGQGGVNLGATFRRYSPQLNRVFVFSNWLDYDRAGRSGAGFAQWGLHAASIGQFWSVRSNIHLPVGQSNEIVNRTVTPAFFRNTISLVTNGIIEDAYGQYDIEFSTPIPYFARFGFEFGLGYYYLDGARHGVEDGHGVSTRVETQVTENMWANAYITSDGVFGSNLSLNFEITLPNGAPSRIMRRLPLKQYLVQSDRRKYRVVRNYSRFTTNAAAMSTADCFLGQQINVVHIDPRVGGGGDGTFENPFGSLAAFESQADSIQSQVELIYVHGNNDPDSDANLNTGITLFDCQRLLGAGVQHIVSSQQGNFILNPTDASNPFLSNSGSPGNPVVTLADQNEVSGFRIDASGGTGDPNDPNASIAIDGRDLSPFDAGPVGVRDFNINRNLIQNAINGILINTETSGVGVQTGIITENEMIGFSDDAIQINASGAAQLALTIDDNDITGGGSIVGLGFLIDGNTFGTPFDITNTSAGGLNITSFMLDLTDVNAIWDSEEPGASIPFQPQSMTDVLTGLVSVNGNLITPGTDPLQDDMGAVLPGGGVPDDQPILDLVFNDFNAGETFSWLLDSDFVGLPASTILGSDLIGADITVNFQGGLFLTGQLTCIAGNPDASEFVATGGSLASGDGDGIEINLAGSADILAGSSISRNNIRGIARDSIRINGPGTSTATLLMSDNAIVGSGRHGMNFVTRDAEVVSIAGTNNSVMASGGDGLHMETFDTSTLNVAFTNSQFDTSGGNGVDASTFDDSELNFSLTSPSAALSRSSATNNGGFGMSFEADDNSTQNVMIDDVSIVENGDDGVFIHTLGSGEVDATITGSTIDDNTGLGLHVESFDTSRFELTAGGPLAGEGLSLVNNIGAGIGVLMEDEATGLLDVANSVVSNTQTAAGPLFTGEGILAVVREGADLEGSITGSMFEDNAADGVRFRVNGNSFPDFARLLSFSVGGPDIADGNVFRNNGGNGLAFIRTGNGRVGTTSSVLIQNNLFESNVGDGMLFDSAGTPIFTDRYTVLNNTSTMNSIGAHMFIRADAHLRVDMDQNTFDSNMLAGIQLNEEVNTATDQRFLTGTWTRNEVTNNMTDGIGLHGAMSGLLIGDLADTSLGNHIAFNPFDGINITGPGSVTIGSNLIEVNGSNTSGAGDNDAGIDIHSATFFAGTIQNNVIINNNGDGIELESDGVFPVSLDVQNNFIAFNDGRGFDVLAQPDGAGGSSLTDIDFHDNIVNENGEEGVYVVFTSSTTQTQDGPSTDALLADGAIDSTPFLRFDMTGNQILGNGQNSGLTATGLVVRVGTTGGDYGFTDPGGFASNGLSVDSGFTRSGVIMRVADNQFGGNFGNDVLFHSFVSTVDPATTAGSWTDVDFGVATPIVYHGDPLARLDLHWDNNAFDSHDVNNGVGVASANPQLVAFYDDAEGTFKSRDNTQTDPGPFTSDTRRRNAQRQAARIPFFTAPATPGGASDTFLYAGLGESTFRVRGADAVLDGFITDNVPYTTTADANGLFLPGSIVGELPFGWTFLP